MSVSWMCIYHEREPIEELNITFNIVKITSYVVLCVNNCETLAERYKTFEIKIYEILI